MTDDVAVNTEIQGVQYDDETRAALLLFNERIEASAAEERAAKRIAKAERAKDQAAAVVRKFSDDPSASAEDKAEAEANYKAAVENYQVIRANPDAGLPEKKKPEATDEAPAEEASTDEAPAEEASTDEAAPLAEVSADEEPSDNAPAASDESE